MTELKEAIEYLTKDVAFWDNFDGEVAELHREDYDQALAILKEQPPAGDFTKELRNFVKMYEKEIPRRAEITFLDEACVIIDRQAAQLKAKDKLLFAYESVRAPKIKEGD